MPSRMMASMRLVRMNDRSCTAHERIQKIHILSLPYTK